MKDRDTVFAAATGSQSASAQQAERRNPAAESVGGGEFATRSMAAAWDPYEVWLTRVKRPRDQQRLAQA